MGPAGFDDVARTRLTFWRKAWARWLKAGTREPAISDVAATWMADGNTSLEDWDAFTWSLGWTAPAQAFRGQCGQDLVHVHVGRGSRPGLEDVEGELGVPAALRHLEGGLGDGGGDIGRDHPEGGVFQRGGPFTRARPGYSDRSMPWPETGKFSTARWVCACHLARAGTLTSPMESCSTR